jgi:DNA-binding MltR family transcriptional regulator
LEADSDFVCVIVGTSYVDYALGALLKAYFLDVSTAETLLQPTGGNLGSLYIKSSLAYCLGLISKGCKANIDRIAEVRNQFAHRLGELNFSDQKIAELCEQIKLPAPNENVKTTSDDPSLSEIISSPRKRFEFVVCIMCTTLWACARNVRQCTPVIDSWK